MNTQQNVYKKFLKDPQRPPHCTEVAGVVLFNSKKTNLHLLEVLIDCSLALRSRDCSGYLIKLRRFVVERIK